MLIDNLYTLDTFSNENGKAEAGITIDANHEIFKGHFPGQPVLPGVCMIQIVKELTEKATGEKLFLHQADQCKFLSMVDPTKTNQLKVTIDYTLNNSNEIEANAILKSVETIFLKMKCGFRII